MSGFEDYHPLMVSKKVEDDLWIAYKSCHDQDAREALRELWLERYNLHERAVREFAEEHGYDLDKFKSALVEMKIGWDRITAAIGSIDGGEVDKDAEASE